MDIITKWSKFTLKLINIDKIIESYDVKDCIDVENKIKNIRNKDVKINRTDVKQLAENGALIFWSEILKYVIVLSIAYCINIFLPTFLIMSIFTTLRASAGGVHMSTVNKCFAVMIVLFLSFGYIVSQIYINALIIIPIITLGFIWSLVMAIKYAPQERPNKSDKDCNNGNKMKHRTIAYIIVSCVTSLIFINDQLISLSIFTGTLLEILTITPIGAKVFQWLDNKKVTG